jgi:hypothetical protein
MTKSSLTKNRRVLNKNIRAVLSIFYLTSSVPDPQKHPDPLVRDTDPRIRIRIRIRTTCHGSGTLLTRIKEYGKPYRT